MLRAEFVRRERRGEYIPQIDFRPVTVTGSETAMHRPGSLRDYWRVPKKDLIFPLVAAFQQRRVRIAKGVSHRDALAEELRNYKRTVNTRHRQPHLRALARARA